MSKSEFIKYIKSLPEEELRDELKNIYSRFKDVRKFYTMELGSQKDREKVYVRARKEITNLYLIRGYHRKRPRVQKLNKLFSELRKNSIFPHELIDIYFHSVEHAVKFIKDTRRSQEPVNNHLFKSFESAMELVKESLLEDQYKERIEGILNLSQALYFTKKRLQEILNSKGL